MYSNFTFMTDGELVSQMGMQRGSLVDPLYLNTYGSLDELRITAIQQKLEYLLELKIIFSDFESEEISLISKLMIGSNGTSVVVNKRLATATGRREDNSLRFLDKIDGHIATLHGMLRYLFSTYTPNDTILGHAHNLFTTLLYALIISAFRKNYAIYELPEENRACIRYACACISAKKHFVLSCDVNDVAVPITKFLFDRVSPSFYVTNNNITTYEAMIEYLREKAKLENIDKITFINSILMTLGQRALIILECGVDMIIDCVLSKANSQILSRSLYKMLIQHYSDLQRKIFMTYSQQITLKTDTGGE